jgi:hypothetical protein
MNKSDYHSQAITIETRLPRGHGSVLLSDYARLFSRLSRIYFSAWSKAGFGKGKEDKPNKKDFMSVHQITGRQFNAIKVSIEGMVASQKSNLPRYITEYQSKISGLRRVIAKKKTLINKYRQHKRCQNTSKV